MSRLYTCSEGHDEVAYAASAMCPVCEKINQLKDADSEASAALRKAEDLANEVAALKAQLRDQS